MLSTLRNGSSLKQLFSKAKGSKTNFEKWKNLELYSYFDEEIGELNRKALRLCHEMNKIPPTEQDKKRPIVRELLGYDTDAIFSDNFHCEFGFNIKLGKSVFFNFNCTIDDDGIVEIGDNVMIAPSVTIAAGTHPTSPSLRRAGYEYGTKVKIGSNVWIGSNAVIGPNVTIGDNSVIGAGSVVIRDVPPNSVAVGNPARVVKKLKPEEDISEYIK